MDIQNSTAAKKPKIVSLDDINRIAKANPSELIKLGENTYSRSIENAAEGIADSFSTKPMVLLSGPSGSAKTSTALRLKKELEAHGIKSLVISMDDYFVPGKLEPEPDGKIDYEKPERVDIKLLAEHLEILANGGSVRLPKFHFSDNTRSEGELICREKDTAVIVEGIHALNPLITGGHHDYASFVYVSVRTRIADKSGLLLHPSKIRLMRRLARDKLFRGRDFKRTIANFGSVQRGESLYIMPYKSRANYDIDSFFAFELGVYRNVLPKLCGSEFEKYERAADDRSVLPYFLSQVEEIPAELVPDSSVVKEFIG